MKHYYRFFCHWLALPALILSTSAACAQQAPVQLPEQRDPRLFMPAATQKGASGSSNPRLIAKTFYNAGSSSLAPKDSSHMLYASATSTNISELTTYGYSTGKWFLNSRYNYTYNATNFNTQTVLDFWNGSVNAYWTIGRYSYTANAANYRTNMLYELWNRPTSTYVNGIREAYTLDAANNVTGVVQEIWNVQDAVWDKNLRITETYNTRDQLTDYIVEAWNSTNNVWINYMRNTKAYDASGTYVATETAFRWDAGNSAWLPTKLTTTNTLSGSGKSQVTTIDLYNVTTQSWDPSERGTYNFNTIGDAVTSIAEQWDVSAGTYINNTKSTYSYNTYNQPTTINTLSWVSGAWAFGATSSLARNYYEGEDEGNNNNLAVAAQGAQPMMISVSPNPATDMLHLALTCDVPQNITAIIMDMQGRMQQRISFSARKTVSEYISVAGLPAGNYIISVKGEQGASVQQMIAVAR